jgi:anti-anti-sigma regulatory factor
MRVPMTQWGTVLTERDLGKEIRTHFLDSLSLDSAIIVDFANVEMIDSSFADELFAKLIVEVGASKVRTKVKLVNTPPVIKIIINEAIFTRSKMPAK